MRTTTIGLGLCLWASVALGQTPLGTTIYTRQFLTNTTAAGARATLGLSGSGTNTGSAVPISGQIAAGANIALSTNSPGSLNEAVVVSLANTVVMTGGGVTNVALNYAGPRSFIDIVSAEALELFIPGYGYPYNGLGRTVYFGSDKLAVSRDAFVAFSDSQAGVNDVYDNNNTKISRPSSGTLRFTTNAIVDGKLTVSNAVTSFGDLFVGLNKLSVAGGVAKLYDIFGFTPSISIAGGQGGAGLGGFVIEPGPTITGASGSVGIYNTSDGIGGLGVYQANAGARGTLTNLLVANLSARGTITVSNNLTVGAALAGQMDTPATISLGTSYASLRVGSEAKLKLYDPNLSSSTFGIGASSFGMDFFTSTGAKFNFLVSDTDVASIGASGFIGNGAGVTNSPFAGLNFSSLVTGNFTSVVCGYLKFTNNGTVYSLVVSTNLP